jgi:hypothetical protein
MSSPLRFNVIIDSIDNKRPLEGPELPTAAAECAKTLGVDLPLI